MKRILYIIMVAAMMAACSNDNEPDANITGNVAMTFDVCGDFILSTSSMTRSLTADGKDMTDIWVLDYIGDELMQQVHQVNTDDYFGQPTLTLALGEHHLYFVASRGGSPVLNTDAGTLTFTPVRDTFWKDYAITISLGTASGSRAVTLDRIVTKLKVVFSDAIPTDAATFNVTPATWYYELNYKTGEPTTTTSSQTVTVTIPNTSIGMAGESVSIFGFSSATEWTTNISVSCNNFDSDVLGSATITAAPFIRNRVSEYTGPLFSNSGAMTLSLNVTWDDVYQGTW